MTRRHQAGPRPLFRLRRIALLPLVLLISSCSDGSGQTSASGGGSATQFCDVLDAGAQRLQAAAEKAESSEPFHGLAIALSNLGEFSSLLHDLRDAAPSEIRADMATAAKVFDEQVDATTGAAGSAVDNPLKAIGGAVTASLNGLVHQAAFDRVDAYAEEHCGTAVFGGTISAEEEQSVTGSLGEIVGCKAGVLYFFNRAGNEQGSRKLPTAVDGATPVFNQGFGGSCARPLGLPSVRYAFDRSFSRVAATKKNADGSTIVGFIEIESGQWKQLTPDADDSFGATPAADLNPRWNPITNEIWAERNGSIVSIDPSTARATRHNEIGEDWDDWFFDNEGRVRRAYLPSGESSGTSPNGEFRMLSRPFSHLIRTADKSPGYGHSLFFKGVDRTKFESQVVCGPVNRDFREEVAWLDSTRVLCVAGSELSVLIVDPSTWREVSREDQYPHDIELDMPRPVLPKNSRANSNFFLSPDGKSVIFVSKLGETGGWYSQDLSGGEPKAFPLPSDVAILGWGP